MNRSPFPGMDPFIEARGLWRDFHDKLIGDLERTLADLLPARYAIRLDERTYIDWIDPNDPDRPVKYVEPDVRVQLTRSSTAPQTWEGSAAAVNPHALLMHSIEEVEEREVYLEIRDIEKNRGLVTCLEVMSPTNKRLGSEGWKAYSAKREWLLQGAANFVELDLLRGGRRRLLREPWPESPYYILVSRKVRVPECEVLPAYSHLPLPELRIPLLPSDEDVIIDLQSIVNDIVRRSRYYADFEYDQPAGISLSHDESVLLANFLREAKSS